MAHARRMPLDAKRLRSWGPKTQTSLMIANSLDPRVQREQRTRSDRSPVVRRTAAISNIGLIALQALAGAVLVPPLAVVALSGLIVQT